jgi:hypothetical protein
MDLLGFFGVLPNDAEWIEEPQQASFPQLSVAKRLVKSFACVQVQLARPETAQSQSWLHAQSLEISYLRYCSCATHQYSGQKALISAGRASCTTHTILTPSLSRSGFRPQSDFASALQSTAKHSSPIVHFKKEHISKVLHGRVNM